MLNTTLYGGPSAGPRRRLRGMAASVHWAALCLGIASSLPLSAATLEEAVRQALTTNPQLTGAAAAVRAAGHDVREARAGYLPSVDLDSRFGEEHSNIKQLNRPNNDDDMWRRESGLTVTQLVWDGMATASEVKRRTALLNSAENSMADTQNALAFKAVEAYVDVLRNRDLVALARANVSSHEEVLRNVEAKSGSGVGNKADVEQARARVSLAKSTLTARQGGLHEAEARYVRVIGDQPGELAKPNAVPSGLVKNGEVDPNDLALATDKAQEEAMAQHPAVMRSKADIEAAMATIRAARAGYQPRLDLQGTLRRDNDVGGISGNRDTSSLMLVARWNLFRGGADLAQTLSASERKTEADNRLDDTFRSVAENVAIAMESRATSESRLAHLQHYVAASEGTLQAYRAQFEISRRTLLDLLNAEDELFNARSNLAAGTYDDLINVYFVDASKGILAGKFGVSGGAP
jgi:adhesin transport system outer membrane protein